MKTVVALLLAAVIALPALAGDYAVIVNKENKVSQVSKADLKRVFLGKKKDLAGTKVVPINLDLGSETAKKFLQEIVGMSPDEYKQYWVAQQVKGLDSAPMVQKTSAAVKAMVSQLPGAISYVESGAVDDTVKKLTVK